MKLTVEERRWILIQVAKAVGVKKGGDVTAKPTNGSAGGPPAARL